MLHADYFEACVYDCESATASQHRFSICHVFCGFVLSKGLCSNICRLVSTRQTDLQQNSVELAKELLNYRQKLITVETADTVTLVFEQKLTGSPDSRELALSSLCLFLVSCS